MIDVFQYVFIGCLLLEVGLAKRSRGARVFWIAMCVATWITASLLLLSEIR